MDAGAYVGAPLVDHVQVHVIESIDLHHGVVRRRVQRDQHQLLGCWGSAWVSVAGVGRGGGELWGRGLRGGASPELGAENLTTKGSRLKASSGSGYWYVSTTDTASFLGERAVGSLS